MIWLNCLMVVSLWYVTEGDELAFINLSHRSKLRGASKMLMLTDNDSIGSIRANSDTETRHRLGR